MNKGNDVGNYLYIFFNQIGRFSVPIFLMSSGFGLTYQQSFKNHNLKLFYRRRFKLLPEYLFWTFLYLIVFHIHDLSITVIGKAILLGDSNYHMYFVVLLLYFYLLYPFIEKIAKTNLGLLIATLISVTGQVIFQFGMQVGNPYIWNWLFYFVFGIYLAGNYKSFETIIKHCNFIFGVGIILLLSSAYLSVIYTGRDINTLTNTMRPTVIIYSIGVLALGIRYFDIPNKLLEKFDVNSLGMYYVHPLFLLTLTTCEKRLCISSSNFLVFICNLVFVIMLSYLFSVFYSKFSIFLQTLWFPKGRNSV